MSEPVNRTPYLKVFVNFQDIWPLMDNLFLTDIQKQHLVYHILSFMEIDLQAVLNSVNNNSVPGDDDLMGVVDANTIVVIATALYNLLSYNNLFVIEVDDDSLGLVREFPWGALHVDKNTLVLVGEGLPKVATVAYQPSLFDIMAANSTSSSSKIV